MNNLHFNIEKSLGKKLYDIAIEKIIVNHNVDDAINIFTKALIGLSKEYAIDIITGKYYLVVENGDMILMTPDDVSENDKYELIDIYNRLQLETDEYKSYLITKIKNIQSYFNIHKLNPYNRELFNMYIRAEYINHETINDDTIYELSTICFGLNKMIKKISDFIHFLPNIKMLNIDTSDLTHTLVDLVANINEIIFNIINGDDINDIITEVEITDKYDAGWLAPDGKFYGMNGHINEMLHMQLASKIIKNNNIEKEKPWETDEWTLEKLSYVKIHHDWILFSAAAFCNKELTEKQVEQIIRYGNVCYGQKLFFGDSKTFCSTARFANDGFNST